MPSSSYLPRCGRTFLTESRAGLRLRPEACEQRMRSAQAHGLRVRKTMSVIRVWEAG